MKNAVLWIITALSMIITAAVIDDVPDEIPMHYDFQGNVDRYGSKYELFIYPCLMAVVALMWMLLLRYFRKKIDSEDEKTAAEAKTNIKVVYISSVVMMLMQLGFQIGSVVTAFRSVENPQSPMPDSIISWIIAVLGITMMVVGNLMPKTKRNGFFGLRTVWSVKNDKIWFESNRFAGVSFFVCGLFMTVVSLMLDGMIVVNSTMPVLIAVTFASVIYSYIMYRKHKD